MPCSTPSTMFMPTPHPHHHHHAAPNSIPAVVKPTPITPSATTFFNKTPCFTADIRASYEILGQIGEGRFGLVTKGRCRETGELVAIKSLRVDNGLSSDISETIQDIHSEIRISSALSRHPGIPTLHKVIIDKPLSPDDLNLRKKSAVKTGQPACDFLPCFHLVFEFAEGGDYLKHILQVPGLHKSEAECKRFFKQLLAAVHYAHLNNIVHRDLKLENLFIRKDGRILVGDWGLASKYTPEKPSMQWNCGSPHYKSPEIVMNSRSRKHSMKIFGPESDIWSMGVLLFIISCGTMPFLGTEREIENAIVEGRYRFPSSIKISAQLKDLIVRMMEVDARKRIRVDEILKHPWLN